MEKIQIYEILEEQYFGGSPHEEQELAGLQDIIPENIVRVIDVGASLCQYTRTFSQILKGGEIIAIEADPIRFDRLQEHCVNWRLQFGTDIRAVHGAACGKSGDASFFTTESNVSGAINQISERSSTWKEIHVPAHTLDEMSSDKNNTFVKMDIEGGEYGAMLGATQLLAGNNNLFLLELHVWGDQKRKKTVSDVLKLFQQRNYAVSSYFGHYLFQKADRPNNIRYLLIALSFRIKRIIYFSPFRSVAIRFKKGVQKFLGSQG